MSRVKCQERNVKSEMSRAKCQERNVKSEMTSAITKFVYMCMGGGGGGGEGGISNLHAVDTGYHADCMSRFMGARAMRVAQHLKKSQS